MNSGILQILRDIGRHPSRIDKETILKSNIDNELLKKCFRMAYDPHLRFFIQKIPDYDAVSSDLILDDTLEFMESELATRKMTGNSARDQVKVVLSNLHPDDALVASMVLGKDLRCGVTGTTVNKVWKGLIPEMKVMLAGSDITKIEYPAIAQPKLDGLRAHITLQHDSCLIQTRNGKIIDDHGFLFQYAKDLMEVGETWDGEIVCVKDGDTEFASRQESNGILNKAIKGTITDREIERIRFNTWDIIIEGLGYASRLAIMKSRFETIGNKETAFLPVYGEVVQDHAQVMELYEAAIGRDEEGLVVKNLDSLWKGSRSKDLCKIKEILECDLIITGWEEGTGRNVGYLGNLVGETSDGKLRVSVGTGFSDNQRRELTAENTIGKVMSVRYNQVIREKNSDKYSLFLPRFVEIRDDKDSADSIQLILN